MASGTGKKRAIVVDPACVARFGHNPSSLDLFGALLRQLGFLVIFVVPEGSESEFTLPEVEAMRTAPHPYMLSGGSLIEVSRTTARVARLCSCVVPGSVWRRGVEQSVRLTPWFLKHYRTTVRYFAQLVDALDLGPDDLVILPSADLLTTAAVARSLRRRGARGPRLALRFINVLENIGPGGARTKRYLWRSLSRTASNGTQVRLGFETEAYFRSLPPTAKPLGAIVPYPPRTGVPKRPAGARPALTIGALGAARPDKGFTMLPDIIAAVLAGSRARPHFVVQAAAHPWGPDYDRALEAVSRYEQATVLPGVLSSDAMQEALLSCDALLLPYAPTRFAQRASAMLFDACDVGIPSIVRCGTAFGEAVVREDLGLTFTEIGEIPGIVDQLNDASVRLRIEKSIEASNSRRLEAVLQWLN